MRIAAAPEPTDKAPTADPADPEDLLCDDCDQRFKNAQGLAGHRRLAHSATTRLELEAKASEVAERDRAAKRRESEAAQRTEAARRREADVSRREQEVAASEAVPEHARIRRAATERIRALPQVTEETILRVNGDDYRVSGKGGLVHLYWPKGEKTPFEEGARFQFAGRAYCIRGVRLQPIPTSTLLAELLGEED